MSRRPLVGLLAMLLVAALAAGCGGDDKGTATKKLPKLVVVSTVATPSYGAFYLAMEAGYFKDAGLDVSYILGPETTIPASMLSGHANIGMTSTADPLSLTQTGKDTTMLFNMVGGGAGVFVAGLPSYSSPNDCKHVISQIKGQSSYAAAEFIKRTYNADFKIDDRYSNSPDLTAAAIAGQGDCLITSYNAILPVIDAGKMKLLVDPSKQDALPASWPKSFVEGGLWVMTDKLKDATFREAVERFLGVIDKARTEIADVETPEQIAARFKKNDDFSASTPEQLANVWKTYSPMIMPNDGRISEADWRATTEYFIDGGIVQGSPDDELWSYKSRVDPSLIESTS